MKPEVIFSTPFVTSLLMSHLLVIWIPLCLFFLFFKKATNKRRLFLRLFVGYLVIYHLVGIFIYFPNVIEGKLNSSLDILMWPFLWFYYGTAYFQKVVSDAINFYANLPRR